MNLGQSAAILTVQIRANTAAATSQLRRFDDSMKRSASTARATTAHTDRLQRSSGRLGTTLGAVGKAAVGAAAAYIGISQAKQAIDVTTELAKSTKLLQNNLKLSAENASSFAAVAKTRNVDTRGLAMATKTLATQTDAANKGVESSIENFKALGISQKELKNLHGEKLLLAIAEGAKEAGKTVGTTAALGKLLGRSFAPLGALFRDGAKGMKEQQQTAKDLGASFDNLGAKNMNDLVQRMRESKLAVMGLQIQFTQALQPVLMKAMGWFTDLARNIHRQGFVKAMGDAITQMANKAGSLAPKVAESFLTGFVNAGIWGKLALGGFLLTKFGGLGAFGKLGSSAGKTWGLAFLGAVLTLELGKQIKQMIEGEPLDATTSEKFAQELNKMFEKIPNVLAATIGRKGVTVSTAFGSLVFNPYTRKVIEAHGEKLKKLVGETSGRAFQVLTNLSRKSATSVNQALKNINAGPALNQFEKFRQGVQKKMSAGVISVQQGQKMINNALVLEMKALGLEGKPVLSVLPSLGSGPGQVNLIKPPKPGGKQRGGFLPGPSRGDTIPLMAEGGEFMVNAKATKHFLPLLERINQAVPRFAGGGQIPGNFTGRSPGVVDDIAAGVLNLMSGGARKFLKRQIPKGPRGGGASFGPRGHGSYMGVSMANWVIQALQYAAAHGSGNPQPTSGWRPWDTDSEHSGLQYPHGAVDFGSYTTGGAQKRRVTAATRGFKYPLLNPIGFYDEGHASGTGHRLGGLIKAYQRGGQIFGNRLGKDQLTTLAKYVGMGNPALMGAIAMAESSGITTRRGAAGEYGLWQILPSTADAFGIPKGNLLDPIKNARGAGKILKGQGLRAWTTYTSGAYRKYLGGHVKSGLLARLRGQTGTTGKTSTVTSGMSDTTFGLDVGSSYDSAQANADLLQEILANYEGARSSMIDLISSGNLEALQRYQTGVAQNPLLGIPTPNMPTLASTNLPSALDMYLRSIGINRASTPYTYPGMGSNANNSMSFRGEPIHSGITHHTHVHVDGKEIAHVVEKLNRRSSRRGNRPLPGARGR